MAKKVSHVWGIEIGQSALKALRCHLEGEEVVADTFDYIEYPKILSQPDSEPEKLIADAMQQFISRNDLRHARVAMSVPGQSGLSKFFKPPPVEVKKIPDIVRYEAKQQIPFDLDDVIWDFQQMEGSNIEDGYALESEVGLFAMKREAVFRALKPFRDAGIDIDLIQLAPMSVYNMLAYDRFADRLANEKFDPEHPPKSIVMLSMGTDATDLIVTNGFRVWQRNMPIGGNHFTRQLTKDLKLTFAKAEHLKRNAMQADDPKLIFQALRPVFNDLVTEVQRSIGFFKSLNKKADVDSIVLLGNTVKLPGLQPFLNKNLGFEVTSMEKFERLSGNEVIGAPAFKENQLAFGVVYGLCLQLLQQGPISTNLVPREIVVERIIRAKKPWAVAALAALMLGFLASFFSYARNASIATNDKWGDAEKLAATAKSTNATEVAEDATLQGDIDKLQKMGLEVAGNAEGRFVIFEFLETVMNGVNRKPEDPLADPYKVPYETRPDLHFTRIDSLWQKDLAKWYTADMKKKYELQKQGRLQTLKQEIPAKPPEDKVTGKGWVVEIEGYHYFNGKVGEGQEFHLYKTLLEYLENGKILLPEREGSMPVADGKMVEFTMAEMGISHPILVSFSYDAKHTIPNQDYLDWLSSHPTAGAGAAGGTSGRSRPSLGNGGGGGSATGSAGLDTDGGGDAAASGQGSQDSNTSSAPPVNQPPMKDGKLIPQEFPAPKYKFTIQFIWKENRFSERMEAKKKAEKNKAKGTKDPSGVASNP